MEISWNMTTKKERKKGRTKKGIKDAWKKRKRWRRQEVLLDCGL